MHHQENSSASSHVRGDRTPSDAVSTGNGERGDVPKPAAAGSASAPKKFSFSFGKKSSSSSTTTATSASSANSTTASSSGVSGRHSRPGFSFSLSTRQAPLAASPVSGGLGGVPSSRPFSTKTPGAGIFDIEEEKQLTVQQVLSISKDGGWETQGGEEQKPPLVIPCLNRLAKPAPVDKLTRSSPSTEGGLNGPSKKQQSSPRESEGQSQGSGGGGLASLSLEEERVKQHGPNYLKLETLKGEEETPTVDPVSHNSTEIQKPDGSRNGSIRSSFKQEESTPSSSTAESKGYGLIIKSKPPTAAAAAPAKVKSERPSSSSSSSSSSPPSSPSSSSLDDVAAQALIAEARGEADASTSQAILPILSRNEKLAELRRKHRERLQQHRLLGSAESSSPEGDSPPRSSGVRGRGSVFYVKESSSVKSEDGYHDRDIGGERDTRPEVFSREQSERELLREELKLLPDAPSTTSTAYSAIPIDEFGLAMLRGMGYDPEKDKARASLPKERKKRVYNRAGLGSEEEIEKLWLARQNKLREEAAQKKKQKMEEMMRSRRG